MQMNEPAVVITDFAITALCLILSWRLWCFEAKNRELKNNFLGLFLSAGFASFLGGVVHGFLPSGESDETQFFWVLTLMGVGVSSYNVWLIDLHLLFNNRIFKAGRNFIRFLLVVYVLVVLFASQKYYVAIMSYIPPAFVLLLVLLGRFGAERTQCNFFGLVGLVLTFVAAYVQQAGISLHPIYFNYNALYHTLQAFGFIGLYLFGRQISNVSAA